MTFERCIMHDLDAIVHIDLMIYCMIREEVTSNTTPLITHIKYNHRYIMGKREKKNYFTSRVQQQDVKRAFNYFSASQY